MSLGERRQHRRHIVNLRVLHKDPRTQKQAMDYARDLSEGGLFLRTKRKRMPGERLTLEIGTSQDPRDRRTIVASGEVARVTAEGVGIRFDDLPPQARELLRTLLMKSPPT